MVRGAGMGISKKAVSAAAGSAAVYVHGKAHEAEQENAAVEGTHRAELMAESALRYTPCTGQAVECIREMPVCRNPSSLRKGNRPSFA